MLQKHPSSCHYSGIRLKYSNHYFRDKQKDRMSHNTITASKDDDFIKKNTKLLCFGKKDVKNFQTIINQQNKG